MTASATILGVVNYALIFIALMIYLLIFLKIKYRLNNRQDISILLISNTCLATFLTTLTTLIMTSSNLFTSFLVYNLQFCYLWGFLYDVFECSIYYSYCLQSFYRLCRIVFYKKRSLVTFSLCIKMIFGQWLFVFSLLLPTLFSYYIRLPTEEYCLVPYTDIHGSLYLIVALYLVPLVTIVTIYLWITTFMRQLSHASLAIIPTQQRRRNLRDLTIIRRLVILVLVLVILRFPTIIFIIYGLAAGHLYFLTYTLVGLITSMCLIFVGLMTVHSTPQLRNNIFVLFNQGNNQVNAQ